MKRRWTESEAWEWQEKNGWLHGCNFIGSDCANRIDMWQSYGSAERLETAEREIALCHKIGFDAVRLIVEFDVWLQEHDSFMGILEKYIALCSKYGQRVMIVLANEAELCRGEKYAPKPLGEQKYALGYHQGRLPLTDEQKAKTPYHELEREETREKYLAMVREIVTKYKDDERIVCWNVFNEPGITVGVERAVPLIGTMFETVRACDPSQPLASDVWYWRDLDDPRPNDKLSLELSDVISWHCYKPLKDFVVDYEILKKHNRPILLTEWLNRINHQSVGETYPLLYLEKLNCWCWGFVAGKTQTYEPWDSLWEQYEASGGKKDLDFTLWQHDLFRPNLRPYDPKEIELIERFNSLDDKRRVLSRSAGKIL